MTKFGSDLLSSDIKYIKSLLPGFYFHIPKIFYIINIKGEIAHET